MDTITVQGPRSDRVHYVDASQSAPFPVLERRAYCGRRAPAIGWHQADDADVNNSTSGICERCLRAYVGPMH